MAGNTPIPSTAADVGARPDTWMPTAAQIGARSDTWTPTWIDIQNKPDIPNTANDIGAVENISGVSGNWSGTEANLPTTGTVGTVYFVEQP